jgi:hypothetical protein
MRDFEMKPGIWDNRAIACNNGLLALIKFLEKATCNNCCYRGCGCLHDATGGLTDCIGYLKMLSTLVFFSIGAMATAQVSGL